MKKMKHFTVKEGRALLYELNKKFGSKENELIIPEKSDFVGLEEFSMELQLSLDIFFEGDSERKGQTITLFLPNGQKFRVTAELLP